MMPVQSFVRRALGAGTVLAGQSGILKTAAMQGHLHERGFHELSTFRLPGRLLDEPITKAGKVALAKMNLSDELNSDWDGSVARLNCLAYTTPGTKPRPFAARYGLAHDQTMGLALAVLQAGIRSRADLDTPEVISLMFHLLSAIPPPDSNTLKKFDAFADMLVEQVLPGTPLFADWFNLPSDDRLSALHQIFDQALALAEQQGIGPGSGKSVRFEKASASPFAPANFRLFIPSVNGGAESGYAGACLSDALRVSAENFTALYPRVADAHDTSVALILPLLSHAIRLASQYYKALGILKGEQRKVNFQEWAYAVRLSISIATEFQLNDYYAASPFKDGDVVAGYLPHKVEAMALSHAVAKAMFKSPAVPIRFKSILQCTLAKNKNPIDGEMLLSKEMSGKLWDESMKLCVRKMLQGDPGQTK